MNDVVLEGKVFDFSAATKNVELINANMAMNNKVVMPNNQKFNMYGMPNYNFSVSFDFMTDNENSPFFSIESIHGGHDRHVYMKNGLIYIRVWASQSTWAATTEAIYNDNEWHSFKMVCADDQGCAVELDGTVTKTNEGVDHSDFNWADTIKLGYSADFTNVFDGKLRNVVYKTIEEENTV